MFGIVAGPVLVSEPFDAVFAFGLGVGLALGVVLGLGVEVVAGALAATVATGVGVGVDPWLTVTFGELLGLLITVAVDESERLVSFVYAHFPAKKMEKNSADTNIKAAKESNTAVGRLTTSVSFR